MKETRKSTDLTPEEMARRHAQADQFKLIELERERRQTVRISPKKILDGLSTEEIMDYLRIARGATNVVMP
jgi:hypothetical protein